MIVGDPDHFRYRSSYYISELFEEAGLPQRHNGQWRPVWAGEVIEEMLASSPTRPNQLPDDFVALLRGVMNKEDAEQDDPDRTLALLALNVPLKREGFEAFYGDDDHLYFKHIGTQTVSAKRLFGKSALRDSPVGGSLIQGSDVDRSEPWPDFED